MTLRGFEYYLPHSLPVGSLYSFFFFFFFFFSFYYYYYYYY